MEEFLKILQAPLTFCFKSRYFASKVVKDRQTLSEFEN